MALQSLKKHFCVYLHRETDQERQFLPGLLRVGKFHPVNQLALLVRGCWSTCQEMLWYHVSDQLRGKSTMPISRISHGCRKEKCGQVRWRLTIPGWRSWSRKERKKSRKGAKKKKKIWLTYVEKNPPLPRREPAFALSPSTPNAAGFPNRFSCTLQFFTGSWETGPAKVLALPAPFLPCPHPKGISAEATTVPGPEFTACP